MDISTQMEVSVDKLAHKVVVVTGRPMDRNGDLPSDTSYDAIVDACCAAWNALIALPERIQSIAQRSWVTSVDA